MAEGQRPAWLTELIGVARQLDEVRSGSKGLGEDAEPKRFGRANRDGESDPGWFRVDLGGQDAEADQLESAVLAPAEGPRQRRFQVMETVRDGNVLKLKVASYAPADGLFLWMPRRASARPGEALADALSQIRHFDLVDRFGQGQADPVPAAEPSDSLNADQARGHAACLAPGIQLIWGPPGTGKTRLIAAALQDLIGRGKSVLLVSSTNLAVDNALGQAANDFDPAPGVMVRVGTPHVADVATDPRISLPRMASDRLEQLSGERADLEEQIAVLRTHPDVVRLENARRELADFGIAAYDEARRHIENRDQLAGLGTQMQQLRERAAASLEALAAAQTEYEQARRFWVETARPRQHLKAATELEIELGIVARECDGTIAEVARLRADRERISHEFAARPGGIASLGRRREHKRLADYAADVDRLLQAAETRRREAEQMLATFSRQVAERIEAHLRAAEPFTDDAVARRRITLSAAERQLRQAWEAQQECIRQAQDVDRQIARTEHEPQPTPADLDTVARADERDLSRKLAGLPELERQASDVQAEIDRLEERDGKLVSQLVQERRTADHEVVRQAKVVATTLDMLRVRPELAERDYDHVVIDEAAASGLPEIVYAVSRATEGATLLGDFLQNGPITGAASENSDDGAIRRWLDQDCFALFGIHDPGAAQASPCCVTLTQQYRFGLVINDLVNDVAYGGLLQVADGTTAGVTDQEIVLLDVDGLGDDLAEVRPDPGGPGQWWPIGALLSTALAAAHAESSGHPVGIVTPYRCQQELIRGQLSESAAGPDIEVGTSHRFQGREFDTVIFDLVENGHGWVAQGRLGTDRFPLDGLRVFNVGITRARRRLYLIVNEALVRKSGAGPLQALGRLVEQGRVRVVRAAELLDLSDEPTDDPIASDIWNALRRRPPGHWAGWPGPDGPGRKDGDNALPSMGNWPLGQVSQITESDY
jgi:AAA domain